MQEAYCLSRSKSLLCCSVSWRWGGLYPPTGRMGYPHLGKDLEPVEVLQDGDIMGWRWGTLLLGVDRHSDRHTRVKTLPSLILRTRAVTIPKSQCVRRSETSDHITFAVGCHPHESSGKRTAREQKNRAKNMNSWWSSLKHCQWKCTVWRRLIWQSNRY